MRGSLEATTYHPRVPAEPEARRRRSPAALVSLASSAAAHKAKTIPYKFPMPTLFLFHLQYILRQANHTSPTSSIRNNNTQASSLSPEGPSTRSRWIMPKVHPNAADPERHAPRQPPSPAPEEEPPPTVLTVWRKSLLFNCDGFTVFDAKGNLAFRVDCYGSARRTKVVLMDVAGKPLLTVRRKRLSLAEHWVIYDGDADTAAGKAKPLLSVRRNVSLRASSKALAYVTPVAASAATESAYVVEGSYGRRACAVRDARGDAVAEVRRKESVGDDVFRLVADPRLGAPLAMGLVIALDEMFRGGGGSARSLLRRTWSAA